MVSNGLIGKKVKVVWLDNGSSKVIIGELLSFENGLFEVKATTGQIFYINQLNIVSLSEYIGNWK